MFANSKQHFLILDALRGVAAVVVVTFHIFETYSGGDHTRQIINHGYLAVDFFFMLSGYVMAYAYDDRWGSMTLWDFFKRRLIRLHPMIIIGMTIGAIFFYFGESQVFPKVAGTPFLDVVLVMLVGYTMIPLPVSMDVRGWSETYPLNGPAWSLSFEYLANILHGLVLRRLPNWLMSMAIFVAAVALVHLAVTSPTGDLTGGWSLDAEQLNIGITRLLFPYMAGMLLCRVTKPRFTKDTFIACSLLLLAVLAFPRLGGHVGLWKNGLFEALSIIIIFPAIVYLGACGSVKSSTSRKVCTFLGDISYPIYITHYPLIYVYTAWVSNHHVPMKLGVPVGIGILLFATAIAYAALKLYDEPLRGWLSRRFLYRKHPVQVEA